MTVAGWRRMTEMLGVHNQGGPAAGFLQTQPTPSLARRFVMRHYMNGKMRGSHDHHERPRFAGRRGIPERIWVCSL